MTTLSQQIPQVGQSDATEDVKIANNFTTLTTWANGNIDGTNVVASLTGRRLIAQAWAFIGPGVAATTYLIASDGTLIASAAAITKPLLWWDLDPSNYLVAGKSNTTAGIRFHVATNNVSQGTAGIAGNLNAVTFAGTAGNIAATIGAFSGGAGIGTPGTSTATVADATFTFPNAGAYAPVIQISNASTPANTAMSVLWQLYVQNS